MVFSTDVAIIKNVNADAVIAVYPFTPQPVISQAIIQVSDVPVFVGVGGGITSGLRSVRLAAEAEHQGAFGVVVNAPIPPEVIAEIKQHVDIPVIATIVSERQDIEARINAGADILNISAAAATLDSGAAPQLPHHRHRRPHGGEHPGHHSGRGQRHHLHPAHQRAAVFGDDAEI